MNPANNDRKHSHKLSYIRSQSFHFYLYGINGNIYSSETPKTNKTPAWVNTNLNVKKLDNLIE